MNPTKQTIILIEDDLQIGNLIKLILQDKGYIVIWYQTFDTALDGLKDVSLDPEQLLNIKAIIFDYSLDYEQSSVPLVERASRWGFINPMIANSSDPDCNRLLQKAGCTHIRPSTLKAGIVKFLLEEVFDDT